MCPSAGQGGLESIYAVGTQLRHHTGAVWEVVERGLAGDGETWGDGMVLCEGDYRIQGVGASGEATGRTMRVHADYLHGDGWRSTPMPEPSTTPALLPRPKAQSGQSGATCESPPPKPAP